jgi:hypothetical protein
MAKSQSNQTPSEDSGILNTPEVDRLVTLVEEATRATRDAPSRFIEPARGTLDRAKSKRHHLVFGRRGSGKTSLLRKASADLSIARIPSAFVDLEAFKGHNYPDVLLSILIETLAAFDRWLEDAGSQPSTKTTFWKRLFGAKPTRPPLDKSQVAKLRKRISEEIEGLRGLLYSEDKVSVTTTKKGSQTYESEAQGSLALESDSLKAGVSKTKKGQKSVSLETSAAEVRNKVDFLHRHIIDYQRLFEHIVSVSPEGAFVFLDDLYHIRLADQSQVLDYFHRIVKGRSVWLKVGTIRHRTQWYLHGNPPIGLKLGDDCDDIDLDITLEKYGIAKKFLLQVLNQLVEAAGLQSHTQVLVDGGVERIVLASGGVARDFLTVFRRTVDISRERLESNPQPPFRVSAEDVNKAAGEHEPSKRDELKRDTAEERQDLEYALSQLRDTLVERKINCFLVERDVQSKAMILLAELVDLRFVHLIASRTTVRHRSGKLYSAYMLDISQYTGERKRRGLEMLRFWDKEEFDKFRLPSNILDVETLLTQDKG